MGGVGGSRKEREGLACTESFQLGVGVRLSSATVWGIHSWLFCVSVDVIRELGDGEVGSVVGEVGLPA